MSRLCQLGAIAFINTWPFYAGLEAEVPFVRIHTAQPTQLNAMMLNHTLDVSPVSSAFYLQHQQRFTLLPWGSVSSCGSVQSVLLLCKKPLEPQNTRPLRLGIPDNSATSVALLKAWLAGQQQQATLLNYPAEQWQQALAQYDGILLIGDQALQVSQQPITPVQHDLAQWWVATTGLPMVFAVWVAQPEWAAQNAAALDTLTQNWCARRHRLHHDVAWQEALACETKALLPKETLKHYWLSALDFCYTPQHQQSLQLLQPWIMQP